VHLGFTQQYGPRVLITVQLQANAGCDDRTSGSIISGIVDVRQIKCSEDSGSKGHRKVIIGFHDLVRSLAQISIAKNETFGENRPGLVQFARQLQLADKDAEHAAASDRGDFGGGSLLAS